MTLTAFFLIFLSVFLHAGWNFLSKKTDPSVALFAIASFAGAVPWIFFALVSQVELTQLPLKFYLLLLSSNFFQTLYTLGLALGYRSGDISVVYPMGRALPVLLIAGVTMLFGLGKTTPPPVALAGMMVIFAGCVIMPLKDFKHFSIKNYLNKTIRWVVVIAIGTTGYTICDSLAMELLQQTPGRSALYRTLFYNFNVQLLLGLSLLALTFCSKDETRKLFHLAKSSIQPYLVGVFSSVAYALVLFAMPLVTNVSYLQAFRQMSLPLGVFAGIFILKEPCSATRIVGIILIVSGLLMTVF